MIDRLTPSTRSYTIRLLAVLLIAVAGCGKKSEDVKTSSNPPGEIVKKPAAVGLRVSVAEMQRFLKTGNSKILRILDARPKAAYDKAHIPTAVHVNLSAWMSLALKNDGKGLTDKSAWETKLRKLGINDLSEIIVYAKNPTAATRIWWTLKYLGVERAGILDGGWTLWKKNNGKTSTDPAATDQGNFVVEFDAHRLSVIGDLKKSVAAKSVQVIDARTTGEYQRGCIPGAVHLNWENLVTTDNQFLSDEELKQRFKAAGVDPDKPAITYCQTGGRASLNAYALELAGYKNIRNYYSSWRQWGKDASVPKETPKPPAKPIKVPAPKG